MMLVGAASAILVLALGAGSETGSFSVENLSGQSLRYREERDGARDRLRDPRTPIATVLAALRSPRVELRRLAAEAAKVRHEAGTGAEYLQQLAVEPDPTAASKLAVALADHPEVAPKNLRALLSQSAPAALGAAYEQYMRAKIQLAMDGLVHGGVLTGFYQGQFRPLYQLADDMAERLAAMANDDRLNHTVRQLAIMALNESGDPQLQNKLKPLIIDVAEEVAKELRRSQLAAPPASDAEQVDYQRVLLSRYARYALAKAGYPDAVKEKIKEYQSRLRDALERLAPRALRELIDLPNDQLVKLMERPKDPSQRARIDALRDAALAPMTLGVQLHIADMMFEIAYHYQQLKRYDDCIRQYHFLCFLFEQSQSGNMQSQSARYNLACIFALRGDKERALDELEAAVAIGYYDFEWAMEDRDLASIRDEPRFKKLVGIGG